VAINVVPVVLATRCLVGLGEGASRRSTPLAWVKVRASIRRVANAADPSCGCVQCTHSRVQTDAGVGRSSTGRRLSLHHARDLAPESSRARVDGRATAAHARTEVLQ